MGYVSGSAVKLTGFSSWEHAFNSQYPHDSSQPSINPDLGNMISSAGIWVHSIYMLFGQYTQTHKIFKKQNYSQVIKILISEIFKEKY